MEEAWREGLIYYLLGSEEVGGVGSQQNAHHLSSVSSSAPTFFLLPKPLLGFGPTSKISASVLIFCMVLYFFTHPL